MKFAFSFFAAVVCLILSAQGPGAQAAPEEERMVINVRAQYNYAVHLMDEEKYAAAALELERLIHFFPRHNLVDRSRLLLGICFIEENHMEKARETFAKTEAAAGENAAAVTARLLTGETYFRQGLLADAAQWFQYAGQTADSAELKKAADYRLGWTMLREGRWSDASSIFGMIDTKGSLYPNAAQLSERSLEGIELPSKDPATAGILAALLPGLGHAYVTRYRDAAVAFILNGLFTWAAIEAFDGDNDALGVILGLLELGWYSGNIYSAVNVAEKYNAKMQNDFRRSLHDSFDALELPPFKNGIGFSISFRF